MTEKCGADRKLVRSRSACRSSFRAVRLIDVTSRISYLRLTPLSITKGSVMESLTLDSCASAG